MKRDGFILIQILFLLVIISVVVAGVTEIYYSQAIIEIAYQDKIQADYLSETILNRLYFNDEDFDANIRQSIVNHMKYPIDGRYKEFKKSIDFKDGETKGNVIGKFYLSNNRKYLELSTITNYNGFTNNLMYCGPVVKDIFEMCNDTDSTFPLISSRSCQDLSIYLPELKSSLDSDSIPAELEGLFVNDYDKISVNTRSSTSKELHMERNETTITKTFNRNIFFIIKNKFNNPVQLEVGQANRVNPLKLSGIIYLEGDLVISGSFEFTGILILNGLDSKIVVNTPIKPIFKGIIFTSGDKTDLGLIDLSYDRDFVYKYGIYLPNFIDTKVEIVKKY